MANCNYPQSGPMQTVQDLQTWTPENNPDPFNLCFVPLKPRPTAVDGALPNEPRLMDCMDLYNGYVQDGDLYPQGVASFDIYTLSYWQYIDILVYFGHYFFMLPTTWWMNVCHRNGVPILGTINGNGALSQVALMVNGPSGQPTVTSPNGTQVPYFVDKLLRLAAYYGFDGWFFNMELSLGSKLAQGLCTFIQSLTENMSQYGLTYGQIHWYDSCTISGDLNYQNCLDDCNLPFLEACNGLFPNYWWPGSATCNNDNVTASPQTSVTVADKAGVSPLEVYTGIDAFQNYGGGPGGETGQFDSYQSVNACFQAGTSAALFAPSWTYQQAPTPADYPARDYQFWIGTGGTCEESEMSGGIGAVMPARPCPAGLPFVTSFNMGNGHGMYIEGSEASQADWGQLGQQELLPTWRFCFTGSSTSGYACSFDYTTAFTGGCSLQISASELNSSNTLRLFQTSLSIEDYLWVDYTINSTAIPMSLILVLSDGSNITLAPSGSKTGIQPTQVIPQSGGWDTLVYELGNSYSGSTITEIDVELGPSQTAGASINLGQIRILPISQAVYPDSVTSLESTPAQWCQCLAGNTVLSATLTWDAPQGDLAWYDIYISGAQGEQETTWIGRAYAETYFAATPVNSNVETVSFIVQPVNTYYYREDITSAATVSVSVPTQ